MILVDVLNNNNHKNKHLRQTFPWNAWNKSLWFGDISAAGCETSFESTRSAGGDRQSIEPVARRFIGTRGYIKVTLPGAKQSGCRGNLSKLSSTTPSVAVDRRETFSSRRSLCAHRRRTREGRAHLAGSAHWTVRRAQTTEWRTPSLFGSAFLSSACKRLPVDGSWDLLGRKD